MNIAADPARCVPRSLARTGHIAPILVGANQAGIKVVDVRDEATTVFAADAVSRLTGVPVRRVTLAIHSAHDVMVARD